MADPFVAEIRIYPFNFPPRGWAFCNGQLLPISQNTALFSLLGTTYGGDGKSTFALPNIQGSAAMHPGQGPGLSLHDLGETAGEATVSLVETEIPAHTHQLRASTVPADMAAPDAAASFARVIGAQPYLSAAPNAQANPNMIAPTGGGQPHNNMQPYLTLNFCIALQGVFPPRS